jgi:hypothetical protein
MEKKYFFIKKIQKKEIQFLGLVITLCLPPSKTRISSKYFANKI